MKKTLLLFLVLTLLLSLASCKKIPSAKLLLLDFLSVCSIEGVVYSPDKSVGEDGYVYDGLMSRIYVYEGKFPDDYAILLNSRVSDFSECGVFVCASDNERETVEEMCAERIRLLLGGRDGGLIIRSGRVVFYSTFDDVEMCENVFRKIIRAHS